MQLDQRRNNLKRQPRPAQHLELRNFRWWTLLLSLCHLVVWGFLGICFGKGRGVGTDNADGAKAFALSHVLSLALILSSALPLSIGSCVRGAPAEAWSMTSIVCVSGLPCSAVPCCVHRASLLPAQGGWRVVVGPTGSPCGGRGHGGSPWGEGSTVGPGLWQLAPIPPSPILSLLFLPLVTGAVYCVHTRCKGASVYPGLGPGRTYCLALGLHPQH